VPERFTNSLNPRAGEKITKLPGWWLGLATCRVMGCPTDSPARKPSEQVKEN